MSNPAVPLQTPDQPTFLQRLRAGAFDWVVHPALALLATRILLLFGAYMAGTILPDAYSPWQPYPDGQFLDVWTRGDSLWYLNIATEGYSLNPQSDRSGQTNVVFFPMYPVLVSAVMPLVGGNAITAGVVVSNLCLFIGLIFLYRLTQLEFEDRLTAQRAVFYLAAAPLAYFFSAIYTESTYFLFSVATFYFARKRQWAGAGIAGMFCAATRVVGILILIPAALEWMRAQGWTLRDIRQKDNWARLWQGIRQNFLSALPLLLIPLGLLAFMLYLNAHFNDPFLFLNAQANGWERPNRNPISALWEESTFMIPYILRGELTTFVMVWIVNIAALIVTAVVSVAAWRRLGAAYGVYCVMVMLIPLASGTMSLPRYLLVLFPVPMMLAHWGRNAALDRLILVAGALLMGIFAATYANWGFVA
jgi:hypothetical protein